MDTGASTGGRPHSADPSANSERAFSNAGRSSLPSGAAEGFLRWMSTLLVVAIGVALIALPPTPGAVAADASLDPVRVATGVGLILLLLVREAFARLASR